MCRAAGLPSPVGAPARSELNVAGDRSCGWPEQRRAGTTSGKTRDKQTGDQRPSKYSIYVTE